MIHASKKPTRQTRPLKRGKACMNCRFLKIKCDGLKPICGPCQAHPRDDDCEYSDGPGRSRTKVLEDTVTRLEARLQELENPESSTPSVTLHDPYLGYKTQRVSNSPPSLIVDSPRVYSPLSPFSPTSTTSSLPSGSSGSSSSPLRPPTVPIIPSLAAEEPSLYSLQTALDNFLPHADQFGFFLHQSTFRSVALLAFSPQTNPNRPTLGLLYAVQLMGLSLSQSESLQDQEQQLLLRTVQNVATDLLGNHPNRVVYTLQAEVLLAYYFLRTGQLLAAKHRISAAVSLAMAAGLHKLRSVNPTALPTIQLIGDQPYSLPPPMSDIQEAERINAFWTVFALHKLFSVALEPPANVCGALEAPGIQIDTPWPIDIDNFTEDTIPPGSKGNSTVRAFLSGRDLPHIHSSTTELLNRAAILFHRAAHLTGQWSPSMSERDQHAYETAASAVDYLINQFRAALPPVQPHDAIDRPNRTLLLTHALVDAASIKLHWIFAYAYATSKQICLTAARNLLNYFDETNSVNHVNPIMGNLWLTACHVFVDEISRMRQLKTTYPDAVVDEDDLMDCYRRGLKYMSAYSQDCQLMRYHLTKVQEAFEAI